MKFRKVDGTVVEVDDKKLALYREAVRNAAVTAVFEAAADDDVVEMMLEGVTEEDAATNVLAAAHDGRDR